MYSSFQHIKFNQTNISQRKWMLCRSSYLMPFHTQVGRGFGDNTRLELQRNQVFWWLKENKNWMPSTLSTAALPSTQWARYQTSFWRNPKLQILYVIIILMDGARERGISASLWEGHILVHHCMLGRMKNNRFCKLKNTAENWMATVWGVILWTSFSAELRSGDQFGFFFPVKFDQFKC